MLNKFSMSYLRIFALENKVVKHFIHGHFHAFMHECMKGEKYKRGGLKDDLKSSMHESVKKCEDKGILNITAC